MATAVATAVVRFEAIEVAVEVTTDSMPPMSLVILDCTSPVRVRVKNAIDWRCRWAKTLVRRPCMTCWPTLVLIQVCTTPSAEVSAATATMPDDEPAPAAGGSGPAARCRSRRAAGTVRRGRRPRTATMMAMTMASGQR